MDIATTYLFLKETEGQGLKLLTKGHWGMNVHETVQCLSHSVMSNSVTPWTVACQAPLSMEFSRQEYWSG